MINIEKEEFDKNPFNNKIFINNKLNKGLMRYNMAKTTNGKYSWPINVYIVENKFYIMSNIKQKFNNNIRY